MTEPAAGARPGSTASGASADAEGLALEPGEAELLLAELTALGATLRDPVARARYLDLAREVESGEVGPERVGDLERVLELTLETGRARRMQGADGERVLLAVYGRTPRGAALRRTTEAANQALEAVRGQAVRGLTFAPKGPGTFRLEIATDLCRLTLEIGRRGVTLDSVGVET